LASLIADFISIGREATTPDREALGLGEHEASVPPDGELAGDLLDVVDPDRETDRDALMLMLIPLSNSSAKAWSLDLTAFTTRTESER